MEELENHKHELLKKSGLRAHDFDKLLALLLHKVVVVPTELLVRYRQEAYDLVKDIDPDDTAPWRTLEASSGQTTRNYDCRYGFKLSTQKQ